MAWKDRGAGGGGSEEHGDARIWRLISREMRRQRYSKEQLFNAGALLDEFILRRHPRIVRPEVYAAAVEYTIARADFLDHITQAEVARRYEVSASSVSRIHTDMVQSLGIDLFDARYCTVEPPPEVNEVAPSRLLLDGTSGLCSWDDPIFLEHPALGQIKALPVAQETWGGARVTLRSYVVTPRPFRPDLVLWADEETREILGQRLLYPDDNLEAVLASLMDTMLEPAMGQARKPVWLQVEDPILAQRLDVVLKPAGIEVLNGPTPGVHSAVRYLELSMSSDAPRASYLEGGRLSQQTLARFFGQAASLARARPWEFARDDQVCSVDLFRWGQERVSVSVMGGGGLERGLLIFDSLRDFRRFQRLASVADRTGRRDQSLRVDLLALTFQKGTELGHPRLKEVLRNGWEVADARAYPELIRLDPDNIAVPLQEEDYLIAGACAQASATLLRRQAEAFAYQGAWRGAPRMAEELSVRGAPVVITAPHFDL